MSRRKLILIGPTPPPIHGSAFATLHLIEAVAGAGALADHLETGEDDRPVFNTGVLDAQNLYLGVKHVLTLILLLLRNRDADVHVPISQNRWGFARDAVFIWIAHLARRRVIVHLYGGLFGDFYAGLGTFERTLVRRTFGCVDAAWVETENRRTVFSVLLPPESIRVVENTADDCGPPARDPDRPAPGEPGDRLRILFLSNLIPTKGHRELLAALELLAGRAGDEPLGIDVRLVGEVEPDEAALVRAAATRLAAAGADVELRDAVMGEGKLALYRWADVLALPSRYPPEGQPLVLLEAMSAGLAVIGSDHSGIPHTVLDGEQGLIVPKGNAEALAGAVERMRGDPELVARLGRAGRRRYEEHYALPAYEERVRALLAERGMA